MLSADMPSIYRCSSYIRIYYDSPCSQSRCQCPLPPLTERPGASSRHVASCEKRGASDVYYKDTSVEAWDTERAYKS